MVSVKDIAARCGVSAATVSKALNNHDDVAVSTKREIRRVAKEMGYHPNSSARALKTNRSYNLGVLYKDATGSGFTHDYFAWLLESFKNEAENNGYDITFLSNCKNRKDRMSYLEHSIYRRMDGVIIIVVADYSDPEVAELLQSGLPVVLIDHAYDGRISIGSNNDDGMRRLLDYVYAKGHRRIAFVHGEDTAVTRDRLAAFLGYMAEKGIEPADGYLREGRYRDSHIAGILTNELLDMEPRPSCILYSDDLAAIGGMNAIKDRGLKIPGDISVAGFDGIRMAGQLEPKITTYWQNTKEIGAMAAKCLIGLIENPKETPIRNYYIDGMFLEGGSVGAI